MKLVQLLAKELKEWPKGVDVYAQDANGQIFPWVGTPSRDNEEWLCEGANIHQFGSWFSGEEKNPCDDHMTANVTKSQWQAEREKMNKPKWIRHRGGNSTLNPGTMVEARLRSGEIQRAIAGAFLWDNSLSDHAVNIMAYRVIEETKDQEIEEVETIDTAKAPTIEYAFGDKDSDPKDLDWKQLGTLTYKLEIDATEATKEIDSLVAKWGQIESPLKWRDEIIELEAYEEEFRREREKLILKLESEGLKLIDHMAPVYGDQIIDFSDWRNWQAGDIVECITDSDNGQFTIGVWYEIKSVNRSSVQVVEDDRGSNTNGWGASNFKFSSRP